MQQYGVYGAGRIHEIIFAELSTKKFQPAHVSVSICLFVDNIDSFLFVGVGVGVGVDAVVNIYISDRTLYILR